MSLDTYANFQAAIADHLVRTDLTTQIVDCITLFEAEAANELFRNRHIETTTILIPSETAAVNITGAADNGSGLIRLTVSSTSTFTTGQEVSVSSVGGTTEANGTWIATVISGILVDLQGSTFTNTYTSGGTARAPQGIVALPTDFLGWRRVTWTGTPATELSYVHPALWATEFRSVFPLTEADPPQIFTIEGNYLKIMPPGGTPIEFDYYAKNTAISSSLNWLFTNRVDAYWNGVLEQIYTYTRDYEKAQTHQQKKAAIYDSVKKTQLREAGQLAMRVMGSQYGQTP